MQEEDLRKIHIGFRVSEEELGMIRIRMKDMGITSRSEFLRELAISGYIVRLQLDELKDLIRLTRYAGNNLNQLTRKVNEGQELYEEDLCDIKERFAQLIEKLNELIRILAKIC